MEEAAEVVFALPPLHPGWGPDRNPLLCRWSQPGEKAMGQSSLIRVSGGPRRGPSAKSL